MSLDIMSYAIGHAGSGGGGGSVVLGTLDVSTNGTYKASKYKREYQLQIDELTKSYHVYDVVVTFESKEDFDNAPEGYNIGSQIAKYPEVKAFMAEHGVTILIDAWGGQAVDGEDGWNEVTVDVQGGGEPIHVTGDASYAFGCGVPSNTSYVDTGILWKEYAAKITNNPQHTATNITKAIGMFAHYTGNEIPFDIEFESGTAIDCHFMFLHNGDLKKLPNIVSTDEIKPIISTYTQSLFENDYYLTDVGKVFDNFDYPHTLSTNNQSYVYSGCRALRNVSRQLDKMANYYNGTNTTNNPYYHRYYDCYTLDTVDSLGVMPQMTTNYINNLLNNNYRLSTITFDMNEDGTVKTANWKSQYWEITADGKYVGVVKNTYKPVFFTYSGITEGKEVTDAATYAALKNDPDWFTTKVEFSRYNKTSAIETINSLPDTSAYLATAGGTNTIKFTGNAGSATDGGAINTMTEAEIAVAAAKGWTCVYV